MAATAGGQAPYGSGPRQHGGEAPFEQVPMTVHAYVRKEEGMQESDLLDMLPNGEYRPSDGTDHITLVSLGCFCGPKLSFKHIGRGAETLPFDWMRTRSSGVLRFMRRDFEGFFDFTTKKPVPGCNMTTYRGYYHSFWHDDPSDPGMRVRYERRIARFKAMEGSTRPVLFVRSVASTNELEEVPELANEIASRYGPHAALLLIIDFQWSLTGAAQVRGLNNLLLYFLPGSAHVGDDGVTPTPPYCAPVVLALDWMVGKSIQAVDFEDMSKAIACADETHWGYQGLGGLSAFEACPEEEVEEGAKGAPGELPALPPPLPSDVLDAGVGDSLPTLAPDIGVTVVSLGCSPATKMTLQQMGRGNLPLPLDWVRVHHNGVLHFVLQGFEAPLRDGLGAGGQRPAERHGYLDVATRRRVPGTQGQVMCRSHLHSFWHDDLGDPETRTSLSRRVSRWETLGKRGETLLFVRAVATTAELGRADELVGALSRRFGRQACLLLIADFQPEEVCGPILVEGLEDLLVYFLEGSAHQGGRASAPYRRPIECALAWVNGDRLEAGCVPDLRSLESAASPTSWGLIGLGGLYSFEGGPAASGSPAAKDLEAPSAAELAAETAWLEEAKLEATKETFALVALGSTPGLATGLRMLDLVAEDSPFDRTWVLLDGVISHLRNDFREYFDVSTQHVPGTQLTARRAQYHSFWDEYGPRNWREAYEPSIATFRGLVRSSRPKLFAYATHRAKELLLLGDLLEQLGLWFGRDSYYLVVILVGQREVRQVSLRNNFRLLVHFITEAHDAPACADGRAFCGPLRASLDWAVSRPTKTLVVPDYEALHSIAQDGPEHVLGPGGLPLFELGPPPPAEIPGPAAYLPPPRAAAPPPHPQTPLPQPHPQPHPQPPLWARVPQQLLLPGSPGVSVVSPLGSVPLLSAMPAMSPERPRPYRPH